MLHTLKDIYLDYQMEHNDIDKTVYTNIIQEFNILIMEYILEGKEFNMGNNLSTLSIIRRDRDPRSPRIDQNLYNSETDEGVKWHIYHTDDFYCKYYWRKGKCKIKNKSVYRFDATRGVKGNKEKLINLLKEDDLAYLKFKKYN